MSLPALAPDIKDTDTLGFVEELFNDARRKKKDQIEKWNRFYRAFRNRSYSEFRQSWLPSPSSSDIFAGYTTMAAWMTDQRPVMLVSPSPNLKGMLPEEIDPELMKLKSLEMQEVLASWWINRGEGAQIEMALYDTLLYGCGILKTGWDQSLDRGLGDAFLRRVDPYRCLNDPAASSIDDSRYFIEVSEVPLIELYSRFPERGHLVKAGNTPSSDLVRPRESGWNVVPMANPAATGVAGEFPGTASANMPARYGWPGPMGSEDYTKTVTLIECWVKSTEEYSVPFIEGGEWKGDLKLDKPIWQYVAVAGGVVLTPDISNPFEHGQLPYIRLPYMRIGEFWEVSLTEHILPAQIALNRLAAAVQLNAELVGNPILLEDENAGISRTKIVNRPGARLKKNAGSEVQWLNPPAISGEIYNMIEYWKQTIRETIGVSAVMSNTMRRRESEGAVDAVQEASFVRVRAVLRNMEESLRIAGGQVASNISEYYIEGRTISKVGGGESDTFLTLQPRHFQITTAKPGGKVESTNLDFDVTIAAGSTLPVSRQAQAAEADALFFMGAVDDEFVLERHGVSQRDKILQRVNEKKVAGQMPQAQNPRRGR